MTLAAPHLDTSLKKCILIHIYLQLIFFTHWYKKVHNNQLKQLKSEADSQKAEHLLCAWENQVKVLNNPLAWSGFIWAFGIACSFFGILFGFITKNALTGLLVTGVSFAGFISLVFIIAMGIDLSGGLKTRFAITSKGIRSSRGKGSRAAADAAFWMGVATGNPTGVAAGMQAKREQDIWMSHSDVATVSIRSNKNIILVRGGFLQKPIGLYCTVENFKEVEEILRKNCSKAKFS
ncbi:MAG: hypothetical protein ABSB95_07620 [Dissulfurispiraceae bacterium]